MIADVAASGPGLAVTVALGGAVVSGIVAMTTALIKRSEAKQGQKIDAFKAMAERLQVVEEKADDLPEVEAQVYLLEAWAVQATVWMRAIAEAWEEATGSPWPVPVPTPPPLVERRLRDIGPPAGTGERRKGFVGDEEEG